MRPPAAAVAEASWAHPRSGRHVARLDGRQAAAFQPRRAAHAGGARRRSSPASREHASPRRPRTRRVRHAWPASTPRSSNALGLGRRRDRRSPARRTRRGPRAPSRFGTEVVARLLGLRTNHPAAQDALELLPERARDPRGGGVLGRRRSSASDDRAQPVRHRRGGRPSQLPPLTPMADADPAAPPCRSIGYPYVWGGTSERAAGSVRVRGSRRLRLLRLRLARLQAPARTPGAPHAARTSLTGRTTMAMSGEVPRRLRIRLARPRARRRPLLRRRTARSRSPRRSTTSASTSASGWFIHSSGYGVALARSTAGTRRASPGPAVPSPRQASNRSTQDPPLWGFRGRRGKGQSSSRLRVPGGRNSTMLQWKPRFFAVLALVGMLAVLRSAWLRRRRSSSAGKTQG